MRVKLRGLVAALFSVKPPLKGRGRKAMKIHAGYEIAYDCLQPTPMILTLDVHPTRRHNLLTPDRMFLHPVVPTTEYCDGFGNICHVIRSPAGQLTISADFLIED